MTYRGVVVKSIALLAVTVVFAALGWKYTADWFSPTSGLLFFVGYLVLVALTLAAAANPRIASTASAS
jgi:Bax inhibitor 1 like protein